MLLIIFTLRETWTIVDFHSDVLKREKSIEVNKNCLRMFLRIGLKDTFSTWLNNKHLQKITDKCEFKL